MKYLDKIYGEVTFPSILTELIATKVVQRLKKIHQGGPIFLINPIANQTRFEHSLGVMILIQKLGGSIKDQIAGLLHDIPHTAFSHLIDYVLEIEEEDYHEKRYEEVLLDAEIVQVLKKHGYSVKDFLDLEQYPILEYPLPKLSADRIDYTLRDLFQIGRIAQEEIDWFLRGLQVCDGRVVVSNIEFGQWFKKQYQILVTEYFGAAENVEINIIMKKIIQECLTKNILEEKDFFQDDFYVINKINQSFNLQDRIFEIKDQGIDMMTLKTKKRIIDPEIFIDSQVKKLSEFSV